MFVSAPNFSCSYLVALPPLKACFLILFSIYLGVSVMKIPEVGMDPDILELNPCKAGKNLL